VTEQRITLKGDAALLAMRLLALMKERGECVVHVDCRRADAPRWRVLDAGPWERPHREDAGPIDASLR